MEHPLYPVVLHEFLSQYSPKDLARWRVLLSRLRWWRFWYRRRRLLWLGLQHEFLKRVHPALTVTMKANTATCLMLVAISILLIHDPSTVKRRISQVCAAIVAAVGLLTLSQHLFGWDLGIDQLLFTESTSEAGLSFAGEWGLRC